MYKYRPPETDSEDDDYEGFCFGDDDVPRQPRSYWVADPDQDFYDAVVKGDLQGLIKQINDIQFDVNAPIKGGLTLLHYACKFGHIDIVNYLLQNGAKPNRQIDSITALMEACCCIKDGQTAKSIVNMLIKAGAVINVSNKYSMTPFMLACKTGHSEVVKVLIKDAYREACDNQGSTALFYAIENKHPQIVKLLIDAGVDINVTNHRGYTPRQTAHFNGSDEILKILPPEEYKYMVPPSFLNYNSIEDLIPRIFSKTSVPEYFPEIHTILGDMKMEKFLENFALNNVNLYEFLTMTDEKLKSIGIKFPFHRNKIKMGLLLYHVNHWAKNSIARVKKEDPDTFYDILKICANHMQNFITISAAIAYVQLNIERGFCGQITKMDIYEMRNAIKNYQYALTKLHKTTKYLQSFSPVKPPLLIDYENYKVQRKKTQVIKCIKYSLVIGVSIIICLKIKRVI